MNVDGNWCIDYVRRSVAVEVVLLRMSALESYRPFRHQLRYAEARTGLKLALDRQRIHGRTAVDRDRYTMDLRPLILDRDIHGTGNTCPERLMTCNSGGVAVF